MAIWTETRAWAAVMALAMLGGCASTQEDIIPQDGPDMLSIYRSHMQTASPPHPADVDRPLEPAPDTRWSRDAAAEIDNRFPLLPNPWLVLYVYPHLAEDGAPVPGYATAFRMYERDEFALPGEIAAP